MSIFAQWRGLPSSSVVAAASSSSNGQGQDEGPMIASEQDRPITAPGGWGNLLTWRPTRAGGPIVRSPPSWADDGHDYEDRFSTSIDRSRLDTSAYDASTDDDDDDDGVDDEDGRDDDDDDGNDHNEFGHGRAMFTARTRMRGPSSRPRAPIPFQREQSPARQRDTRNSFTPSSFAAAHGNGVQGADSADVSAELLAAEASADLSVDASALDSAFETLTRIKAKDVAAACAASAATATAPSTSTSSPTHRRMTSLTSTEATASRKPSFSYYTPNESPTQQQQQYHQLRAPMPNTWMQWGTSKIRATMPRGIASALFAAMGQQGAITNGSLDEERSEVEKGEDGVPRFVQECIEVICGSKNKPSRLLTVEGIFRVSPSNSLLKGAKESLARGESVDVITLSKQDDHLPAALLKDYLRSMSPPLVPESLYGIVQDCPQGSDAAIAYIRTTFFPALSAQSVAVMECVLRCAHEVAKHSDQNRMDASNLAVVLTPNLVHGQDVIRDVALCRVPKPNERTSEGKENEVGMTLGGIVQLCIEHVDIVFDGVRHGEQFKGGGAGGYESEASSPASTRALASSPWTATAPLPLEPVCTLGEKTTERR